MQRNTEVVILVNNFIFSSLFYLQHSFFVQYWGVNRGNESKRKMRKIDVYAVFKI